MSDTIEPVEHPRNYEIPGWSNADAINARDATIREQATEIKWLRANRDYWMSSCNQAQEHRDGANAQLTIFESENLQLRNELERLRDLLRIEQDLALRNDPFRCQQIECEWFGRRVRAGDCQCHHLQATEHRAKVCKALDAARGTE